MNHIQSLMLKLSYERPVFNSLKDFTDSAWSILNQNYTVISRDNRILGKKTHFVLPNEKLILMMSYRTSEFSVQMNGDNFSLKNQGAFDGGRVGLLSHVKYLEYFVKQYTHYIGYAILLTNDDHYWSETRRGIHKTVDEEFRIHQGRIISGHLNGRLDGKHISLQLEGTYPLNWCNYSQVMGSGDGIFRYLSVPVVGVDVNL
ncbi:hypothetical protein [Ferroacidibacillus organovorans]|uniref:hypothetical protein n=1 Tax=Ferroacidibacillus organovorans TaxID=1765683 RepID=UPI0007A92392|nr:hypothetical protein [Ferroacidibacillus organovorans]KYP82011.1 hypothetical protein AYJ22_15545 [Ferroacidibacillus organovorans]